MEVEIWKYISGYQGYQVSNTGKVKSLERKVKHRNGYMTVREKILKPIKNKGGYLYVILSNKGKHKNMKIHRLVCNAFLQNDSLFNTDINHKDENTSNNNVENLEYCDRKYNCNYGNHNIKNKLAQHNKPILCVELNKVFYSSRDAEKETSVKRQNIISCCNKKYGFKTAGRFHWEWA